MSLGRGVARDNGVPPLGRGMVILGLVGGMLIAAAGWAGARQLHAISLHRMILGPERPAPGWTVALVFQPKECPTRMELVERLNRIAGTSIRVQGILVVDPGEFTNWKDLVTANEIRFPVRAETPERARSALGRTPTPALVVYDDEGRLRLLTDLPGASGGAGILTDIITMATRSPSRGS